MLAMAVKDALMRFPRPGEITPPALSRLGSDDAIATIS